MKYLLYLYYNNYFCLYLDLISPIYLFELLRNVGYLYDRRTVCVFKSLWYYPKNNLTDEELNAYDKLLKGIDDRIIEKDQFLYILICF